MQTRVVGVEVQIVSVIGSVVRQVLANNFQFFVIFFQINAGEVRGFRTFVVVDFFVGFFGAFDYYFLIVNVYSVELFQVVFLTLDKYIVVVRIYVVFDNRYFATRFFIRRVFRIVNKVVQVTFFNLTEVVDFFFYFNVVIKGFYRRLGDREVYVVTQRKNVD